MGIFLRIYQGQNFTRVDSTEFVRPLFLLWFCLITSVFLFYIFETENVMLLTSSYYSLLLVPDFSTPSSFPGDPSRVLQEPRLFVW